MNTIYLLLTTNCFYSFWRISRFLSAIFIIFHFSLLTITCFAQTTFCEAVGGSSDEDARAIIQTTDGGYAIAGETASFGAGSWDTYIVRLDAAGALQWTRTIGGTSSDGAFFITQTSDGGFAITGLTYSFGPGSEAMYIIKIDAAGVQQWTRALGGTGMDYGRSIIQTADGGYVIGGLTNSFGAGSYDSYILKLDASGTVQWTRTVGGVGAEYGSSIIQTTDGGYAIAGQTFSFGAGSYDAYILKLDGSGTVQWTRTVGGTGFDASYSVVQTSDGGYAIAGVTSSFGAGSFDFYIVKLNASGIVQWTRTIGGTGVDKAWSICQTTDGGYAIAGETSSFGAGGKDVYIVKLDASGNTCCSYGSGGTSGSGGISNSGGISGSGGGSSSGGISGIGGILSVDCNNPLPIELLSFTGYNEGNKNILQWQTASETNNDYFTIEKAPPPESPSPKGEKYFKWLPIGTVDGAGNSSQTLHYQFIDNFPPIGVGGWVYYRLKQTDYNGSVAYFNIIPIKMQVCNVFGISGIYPNPAEDHFSFVLPVGIHDEKLSVQIINTVGQELMCLKFTDLEEYKRYTIQVSKLKKGIYYVLFKSGNWKLIRKLIILK